MIFSKLNMKSPLLYRVINVISLILVIISLILAFLLYGKRKELSESNPKMVSAISNIAVILDRGSGTLYSRNLYANSTKGLQVLGANLKKAEKQARDIIKQRNNMGKTLAVIATKLQLPAKFTEKQFQSVKTYQKSADDLVQYSEQVNDRNNFFVDYFVKIADEIQQPLEDKSAFVSANKNLKGYSETLNKLTQNIKIVNSELNSAKEQFNESDSKLKKIEDKLLNMPSSASGKEYKTLITEYEKQLEELQKKNADLTNSISKHQVSGSSGEALNPLEKMHPDKRLEYENKLKDIESGLYVKLTGKVLKYDKKWGFAIIDIGKNNNIDFTIDGREETATVALPLNKEMFVSRENKFIAKVNVIKVVDNYAVVNLSSPSDAVIQTGDTVFFPI